MPPSPQLYDELIALEIAELRVVAEALNLETAHLPGPTASRAQVSLKLMQLAQIAHGDHGALFSEVKALRARHRRQTQPKRCPYPGLRAFAEGDRWAYFGRDMQCFRVIDRLNQGEGLIVLVGASGSGKSSLLQAGILPNLGEDRHWRILPILRPGRHPLFQLAQSLHGGALGPGSEILDIHAFRLGLLQQADYLAQWLESLPETAGGSHILLPIDALEGLFTQSDEGRARQAFLANLRRASGQKDLHFHCVATLRSDFLDALMADEAMASLMDSALCILPPLGRRGLKQAILGPAQKMGVKFEAGLVEELVQSSLHQGNPMPLLQFTLKTLWQGGNGPITWERYEKLGRVGGSIGVYAESIYGELAHHGPLIRRLFLALIRLSPDQGAVSMPRYRHELVQLVGGGVEALLERLIHRRLLRISALYAGFRPASRRANGKGSIGGAADIEPWVDRVEIAHEALIRHWPRFAQWVDESQAQLRWREGLNRLSELWHEDNCPPHTVLSPRQLTLAMDLVEDGQWALPITTRSFIDHSVGAKSRKKQLRLFAVGLSFCLLLSLAIGGVVVSLTLQAERKRAVGNALLMAEENALSLLAEGNPAAAALVLVEAMRRHDEWGLAEGDDAGYEQGERLRQALWRATALLGGWQKQVDRSVTSLRYFEDSDHWVAFEGPLSQLKPLRWIAMAGADPFHLDGPRYGNRHLEFLHPKPCLKDGQGAMTLRLKRLGQWHVLRIDADPGGGSAFICPEPDGEVPNGPSAVLARSGQGDWLAEYDAGAHRIALYRWQAASGGFEGHRFIPLDPLEPPITALAFLEGAEFLLVAKAGGALEWLNLHGGQADVEIAHDFLCSRLARNLKDKEWRRFLGDAAVQSNCPGLRQAGLELDEAELYLPASQAGALARLYINGQVEAAVEDGYLGPRWPLLAPATYHVAQDWQDEGEMRRDYRYLWPLLREPLAPSTRMQSGSGGLCKRDSTPWVLIEGGPFKGFARYPSPVPDIKIPAFELMATEVTVDDYLACVKAGACVFPTRALKGRPTHFHQPQKGDHPADFILKHEAQTYCQWVGGRLPRAQEYEYAVHYLYSSPDDAQRVQALGQRVTQSPFLPVPIERAWAPCTLESITLGNGQVLCDLMGNLHELVGDCPGRWDEAGNFESRCEVDAVAICGASFEAPEELITRAMGGCSKFIRVSWVSPTVGFRCVREI